MSTLLKAALGVCTAFVFMGAVQLIAPLGAMKKSVSYCFSLAFLLVLLIPNVSLGGLEISFSQPDSQINENVPAMASGAAQYLCATALESAGITFKNITVNADICEDGSISINSVRVVSAHSAQQICSALEGLAPAGAVEVINE